MSRLSALDFAKLRARVVGLVWQTDLSTLPVWSAWPIRLLRIFIAVVRDLREGQLNLRAMSLVYTTLLSMVPLLAISFSVLKGFGVQDQVLPALLNFLEPMGDKGVEIAARIVEFVENVKAGVLGSVGLALLIYTVISLMQKIERAFNYTWHVSQERSFAQRFSGYLSVVLVGPLLVFSSLGLTASIMSASVVESLSAIQPIGAMIRLVSSLVPYLLIVGAFTFVYVFMPNTKVRVGSALVGALVAGVLWDVTGWIFASFVVGSAKYAAIYSAFAALVMFMIWLYLGWLILLVGASIAFYHQHPEYLATRREEMRLSNLVKEKLALLVVHFIGRSHYAGVPKWSAEGLAHRLRMPVNAILTVLQALERGGLLTRTADEPPAYVPARALETTEIKQVLDAIRHADEQSYLNTERMPSRESVDSVMAELDRAAADALDGRTIKDLALAGDSEEMAKPMSAKTKPAVDAAE